VRPRPELQAIYDQAVRHHQSGRLVEAEAGYRQVLAAEPRHADSLNLLGVIAAQCGHAEAAIDLIGRAIRLDGRNAGYHINLGLAEQRSGRAELAAESYRRALAIAPDAADAHNNLGILLQDRGEIDEAAAAFERCLAARPDHADALVNLCLARRSQGRLDDAVSCGESALALRPDSAEAANNLGLALDNLGRVADAILQFRRALALRPDYAEAHNNLGLALRQAGRIEAALGQFDRALALRSDDAEAHLNQAMVRLLAGDYKGGWAQYEWRWRSRQLGRDWRDYGVARWDGSAGDGRRILVWAEQGLGDTLQFCRYATRLAEIGWRVVLAVPPPLIRLLRRLDGVERVIASGEAVAPSIDCHCPMMSLPHLFGTEIATIPAAMPYLRPDPADVATWAGRLEAAGLGRTGLRVGLVWAGNPRRHAPLLALTDARRSVTLETLAPLLAIDGIRFVSLQKDGQAGAARLIDPMPAVEDFADTAALVAALDLVIAVDTSTLHLAGAMGKPVWLLNRYDTCWRWLQDRGDSPWYPTLRQFRQQAPGAWDGVVAELVPALRSVVAGTAPLIGGP
jgi:tetratricopeptide (TPR) repeat protein